jgi:membrane protease YdiL (CAAX protease family)
LKRVLVYLVVFLVWNVVAGVCLLFVPPPFGLAGALILSAAYLWGYLLRSPPGTAPERRWATLRLRSLDASTFRWSLAAVPVLLFLSWSLGDVYTRLVPVPPENLNPFETIMSTAEGRLAIAVFAVGVAPLVEEFVFRGLIQRELERVYGPVVGITAAASLFALVHMLPWIFPLHFVLGLAFGFAVYATRSIWTSVILHAANNTAALIGVAFESGEADPTPTLWEIGVTAELWFSLAVLVASIAAAYWLGRRLWIAGRPLRLRSA